MGVHAQLTCATFFSEWLAHYHLVQCAWQMQTQGKGSRMHAFFLEVEREWVSGGSPCTWLPGGQRRSTKAGAAGIFAGRLLPGQPCDASQPLLSAFPAL